MARFTTIIFFLFILCSLSAHPLHVSVVNLEFVDDSNQITVTISLNYEDFQVLINHKYNAFLDFEHRSKLTTKEQNAIIEYIRSSLKITDQKNSRLTLNFNGWRMEDMFVLLYFNSDVNEAVASLKLENALMLDLFHDQKNMVIAGSGKQQMSFEFDMRNKVQTIYF